MVDLSKPNNKNTEIKKVIAVLYIEMVRINLLLLLFTKNKKKAVNKGNKIIINKIIYIFIN